MSTPLLTVIICTYNRANILGECLGSLYAQTASPEYWRVLVVDNNSTDATQEETLKFVGCLPGLSVVMEPVQGLSHARNRGLAEAQTEWVAFLDDDAKAHPGWVEAILETMAKGDFEAFGGPYYAWHKYGPPPVWLPNDFGTYDGAEQYGPLGEFHIPGGNCAFERTLAMACGGFPPELGMSGNKSAYGEETLLFNKMQAQGYRLGFVPDMSIDHCVLPYKYKLRWQLISAFASGRDAPYASEERFSWRERFRHCKHCIKSTCKMLICCCNLWSARGKRRTFILARQTIHSIGRLYTMLRMAIRKTPCPRP